VTVEELIMRLSEYPEDIPVKIDVPDELDGDDYDLLSVMTEPLDEDLEDDEDYKYVVITLEC